MMNEQTKKVVEDVLQKNRGMILGEHHDDRSAVVWLIDHIGELSKQGVKVIGIEGYGDKHDADFEYFHNNRKMQSLAHQNIGPGEYAYIPTSHDLSYALGDLEGNTKSEYARFFNNEHTKRWGSLAKENPVARQMDALAAHASKQQYSIGQLMRLAHQHDIRIVGIDYERTKSGLSPNRLERMNKHAVDAVARKVKPGEKFVLLVGKAHLNTTNGATGLSELLSVPSVAVNASKDSAITVTEKTAQQAAGKTLAHDFVISYPKKTIGAPERILPEANWFSAMPPRGRVLVVGASIAGVASIAGAAYYEYNKLKKEQQAKANEKPSTKIIAQNIAVKPIQPSNSPPAASL